MRKNKNATFQAEPITKKPGKVIIPITSPDTVVRYDKDPFGTSNLIAVEFSESDLNAAGWFKK